MKITILAAQTAIVSQVIVGDGDEAVTVQKAIPLAKMDPEDRKNIEGMIEAEVEKSPPQINNA